MKIANYYLKCASRNMKVYRHHLWLMQLQDKDYQRALALWNGLFNTMPPVPSIS